MIFLLVGISAFRLRAETGSRAVLLLDGDNRGCPHLRHRHRAQRPETFGAIIGIAVLAVVLDLVWK
jgi:hypothetical protein